MTLTHDNNPAHLLPKIILAWTFWLLDSPLILKWVSLFQTEDDDSLSALFIRLSLAS